MKNRLYYFKLRRFHHEVGYSLVWAVEIYLRVNGNRCQNRIILKFSRIKFCYTSFSLVHTLTIDSQSLAVL